jgi:hypothetical protein
LCFHCYCLALHEDIFRAFAVNARIESAWHVRKFL